MSLSQAVEGGRRAAQGDKMERPERAPAHCALLASANRALPFEPRSFFARAALPLGVFAASGVYAASLGGAGASEALYLAFLAAAALAPAALLAPSPASEVTLGALLATAAIWVLPAGPARGAAVALVALATLALALGRALSRSADRVPPEAAVGLALALQIFLVSGRLLDLPAQLAELALLFGLPVLAGLAIASLAATRGAAPVLLAGASALLAGGGFTKAAVAPLALLAAGELLGRRGSRLAAVLLAASGVALLAGETRALGISAAAALALWASGRRSWLGPTAALLASIAALVSPVSSFASVGSSLTLLVLLLPAALLPAARGERALWAAAWLFAFAASRGVPPQYALAAPMAFLALTIPRRGPVTGLQGVWSGTLLAGSVLAAAFPWLRADPTSTVLALLGAEAGLRPALLAGVSVAALGVALARWAPPRLQRLAPAAGGVLVATALFAALPLTGTALLVGDPIVLNRERPSWSSELSGAALEEVVVDSSLANSELLPPGTPVARVLLLASGESVAEWDLTAGGGTGEWAAQRADVAERLAAPPPPAWLSSVPGPTFLAQRYRAVFRLTAPTAADRIEIRRASELPAHLTLALFHLEVRQ